MKLNQVELNVTEPSQDPYALGDKVKKLAGVGFTNDDGTPATIAGDDEHTFILIGPFMKVKISDIVLEAPEAPPAAKANGQEE